MRYRRPLQLAMLFASALMLADCARFSGNLSVDLKGLKECRKLTPALKVSPIGETSDYRALSAEAGGELNKGNKAIARRNRCDDNVIDRYAKAT